MILGIDDQGLRGRIYHLLSSWVYSSKRRNDAENLTLLNNVVTFIKYCKIFGIISTFRRIHPMGGIFIPGTCQHMKIQNALVTMKN